MDDLRFTCLSCGALGFGDPLVLSEAGWRARQTKDRNGVEIWGDLCPECCSLPEETVAAQIEGRMRTEAHED
jgi:hypothetical protein